MFFVRERANFDIFSVLKTIEGKACAFVADKKYKNKIDILNLDKPVILVADSKGEFFRVCDAFYDFDNNDFKFIGITGTKGKTTTSHLIYFLLNRLNQRACLIGTIKYLIGDKEYAATNTTPDYLSLRKIFQEAKIAGINYVVIEVSSHAIEQNRINGIKFCRCIFTNLAREHLDYHKNMANYFRAKNNFFRQNKTALPIINIDDKYGRLILKQLKNVLSYGVKRKADFYAKNTILDDRKISFDLIHEEKKIPVVANIIGSYNISNIVSALATVSSLGFALDDAAKFMPDFTGVEGRLQKVAPEIFVDYAHTPDSLKKALSSVREIGFNRVICVFGCGGNRDKGKRRIMGSVASRFADFSFITSDNPRYEKPQFICSQIEKGFKDKNYEIVIDRQTAISKAIKLKSKYKNCCLVVAGKGHENYQIVADKKIIFKDSEIIRELVGKC
jgi:UDP-N-acetylmuramyl-tripeptide synthetase